MKPEQNWQPMVDPNGMQAAAVVCPLDPGWREYYGEALRLYAKERFRVIWVDDDIRYHNHGPLAWGGCFCALHVAEFNRRAGVEGRRARRSSATARRRAFPHPWREIWMDMWDELHCNMLSGWREIVAKEGCRLGLMSSGMYAHAAKGRRWDRWWKAFGGGGEPVHRPHYFSYGNNPGRSCPAPFAGLDQNRVVQPAQVESGPEIECFPYGRWNKSFRQTGAPNGPGPHPRLHAAQYQPLRFHGQRFRTTSRSGRTSSGPGNRSATGWPTSFR